MSAHDVVSLGGFADVPPSFSSAETPEPHSDIHDQPSLALQLEPSSLPFERSYETCYRPNRDLRRLHREQRLIPTSGKEADWLERVDPPICDHEAPPMLRALSCRIEEGIRDRLQ